MPFKEHEYSEIKVGLQVTHPDIPRSADHPDRHCFEIARQFLVNGPLIGIRQDCVDLMDFEKGCCLHCPIQHPEGTTCDPIHWFLSLIWQVVRHGRAPDFGTDARVFEWPGKGLISAEKTLLKIAALKDELAVQWRRRER